MAAGVSFGSPGLLVAGRCTETQPGTCMLMVASGPAGRERRGVMEAGTRPSVEGIKQAVQSKGGTLSWPVCGREEFTLVEVTVLGSGMAE